VAVAFCVAAAVDVAAAAVAVAVAAATRKPKFVCLLLNCQSNAEGYIEVVR